MSIRAVVLLSGGVDSAVCLADAASRYEYDEIYSVYAMYGQRNSEFAKGLSQEQHSFWGLDISNWYELNYNRSLGEICRRGGGMGIVGDGELENDDGTVTRDDGRGLQYVPMRNLQLLTSAGALADMVDASAVYFGAQAWNEDVAPDARPEFVEAAERALNLSLAEDDEITVRTPLIDHTKAQIVRWGEKFGVPWEYTWSCYESPTNWDDPTPCGKCHSCKERAAAFDMAGVPDPHGTDEIVPEDERGVQT